MMNANELKEILDKHLHWLNEDCDGWEDMKADLWADDLSGADLSGADLRGANLWAADLSGADLSGADLSGAEIDRKYLDKFFPICCPEYGAFVGWKKAKGLIIKLQIPEDAKRSSAFGRKCRCNKAIVLAIETIDGDKSEFDAIASNYDSDFIYRVGETVEVADFDENRTHECAPGIHFFITRQEAVNYFSYSSFLSAATQLI